MRNLQDPCEALPKHTTGSSISDQHKQSSAHTPIQTRGQKEGDGKK